MAVTDSTVADAILVVHKKGKGLRVGVLETMPRGASRDETTGRKFIFFFENI